MSRSTISYLHHIHDETTYLQTALANLNKDDFLADATLKRAVVRSLKVIGEAIKNLPVDLRQKYADVDWRSLAGMRDVLIHQYFGVDHDLVWNVVREEVPTL